jgi:hypothetical protein
MRSVLLEYAVGKWIVGVRYREMDCWSMLQGNGLLEYVAGKWIVGVCCREMDCWNMLQGNGLLV